MERSNNNSYPKTRQKSHRSQLLPTNFTDEHNVLANGKGSKASPKMVSREVSSMSLHHQIPKRIPATPFHLRSLNQPRNRDYQQRLPAVCLDKVYHILWRYRSLKLLQMHEIKNDNFNFIKNFPHTRTIQVRLVNDFSSSRIIEKGVPQGSVLSVSLFLIAINDVMTNSSDQVKEFLFPDELTIIYRGRNPHIVQTLLQNSLQKWSLNTGFMFLGS